ncbi:MAG: hypothetical protein U0637_00840 [Phycisphaerales bacterium]
MHATKVRERTWICRTAMVINGVPIVCLIAIALLTMLSPFASWPLALVFGLACTSVLYTVFGPLFFWAWQAAEPKAGHGPGRMGWVLLFSIANIPTSVLTFGLLFRNVTFQI